MIVNLERKFLKMNKQMGWNKDQTHMIAIESTITRNSNSALKFIKMVSRNTKRLDQLVKVYDKNTRKEKDTKLVSEINSIKKELQEKLKKSNNMILVVKNLIKKE